jgi:type I site-specific restriction-modification system R (restriction) subunit
LITCRAGRPASSPFNKDSESPVNPDGHKTHYLWEDIWQPDTLLELIHNYLHVQQILERCIQWSNHI